ncbi:MAG: SpoIIE family protein phosphatase [Oscillospiraceae bacterium]|nr:SpoIIE family protein phosphatase [Oscillospiraceae bacterium]
MDVKKDVKANVFLQNSKNMLKKFLSPHFLMYPVSFFCTFLLSRGVVLGCASPFGLAASAVIGSSKLSLPGLVGAVLGYMSILDRINSLKYIACIILIFTAHFVFSGTSVSKMRSFAPLTVIVPSTCINLVFLADAGFPLFDCALSALEIAVAALCAILYSRIGNTDPKTSVQFSGALLALIASAIVPLCDISLFDTLSVGRIFAYIFVLLSAMTGGLAAGALVGIVVGFAVSISLSSANYCMIYGAVGLLCAGLPGKKRYLSCICAAVSGIFISVCLDPGSAVSVSLELAVAATVSALSANVFSRHARRFFIRNTSSRDAHIRTHAITRLGLASNAFRSLSRILGEAPTKRTVNSDSDEKTIFERTSREICKKCKLAEICWKRDFETTRDALNNAGNAIRKNGTLSSKDFPIHFSSRCLHIESFVNSVNREIFAMRYRNQFNERLRESRELVTRQYSDASAIFAELSSELSENARFDEDAETALRDHLSSRGILCDTSVYRDFENHINIHICGKDLREIYTDFKKYEPVIRAAVGVSVSAPEYTHGEKLDDVIIREKPNFRALFGAAVKRRSGSEISGDSGSFFRPSNGKLAVLLSDGMGSGRLAANESASSVTLLEGLLKSGIAPSRALCTLHAALSLKSEYTGAFATLDLMYADMFSGMCDFYKFGGAPTYIKRGRHIRRITASSLPAGMNVGKLSVPDKTSLSLCNGDFIIMTSDGIADENDDTKLLEFLSRTDETSPKALADALLAYSLAVYGKNDDMTVAVVLIESEAFE